MSEQIVIINIQFGFYYRDQQQITISKFQEREIIGHMQKKSAAPRENRFAAPTPQNHLFLTRSLRGISVISCEVKLVQIELITNNLKFLVSIICQNGSRYPYLLIANKIYTGK